AAAREARLGRPVELVFDLRVERLDVLVDEVVHSALDLGLGLALADELLDQDQILLHEPNVAAAPMSTRNRSGNQVAKEPRATGRMAAGASPGCRPRRAV